MYDPAQFYISRETITKWNKLPAPHDLLGGLPNVWCLRIYSVKVTAPLNELNLKDHRDFPTGKTEPKAEYEVYNVELAPFNVETRRPFFENAPHATLSMLGSVNVEDNASLQRTAAAAGVNSEKVANMGHATNALRHLLHIFTTPEDKSGIRKPLNPVLQTAICQPLGSFRPKFILFHDANFMEIFASACEQLGLNKGFALNDNIAIYELIRDNVSMDRLNSQMAGTLVSCSGCETIGVEREGHPRLKRMQKCSGCGVNWYCTAECQKLDWKRLHKQSCKTFKQGMEAEYPRYKISSYGQAQFHVYSKLYASAFEAVNRDFGPDKNDIKEEFPYYATKLGL